MTESARSNSLGALLYLTATLLVEECVSQETDPTRGLIWSTKDAAVTNRSLIAKVYRDPTSLCATPTTRFTNIYVNHSAEPLSFDYIGSTLYYADWRQRKIMSIPDFFNLSSIDYIPLPTIGVSDQVTGVAVDWVSRLIFWADASNQLIGVITMNTSAYWRPVVDSGLAAPQDVAVYAIESYLFWLDGGSQPKIERSILSGDNRTVLVASAFFNSPTILEIDVIQKRLYWLDSGAEQIGSIYFDGSSMSFWIQSFFSQVSAFTFFQDVVYFGYRYGPQFSAYYYSGTNITSACSISALGLRGTIDMTPFAPENQPYYDSVCLQSNGGCDHICYTMYTSRLCGCAMGFFLDFPVTCYTQPFEENFLIMSDTDQRNLFQVQLETGEVRALIKVSFPIYPTVVDFDPISKNIFWFDNKRKAIMKSNYNQSMATNTDGEIMYTLGNGSVISGMVLDVSADALYIVDSKRGRIGRVNISTKAYTEVITNKGGTAIGESPMAITLDIANSFVYWSRCASGYSVIICTDMSTFASHRNVINVTVCISALALDSTRGVLYWGTDSGSVETCTIYGTGRVSIHTDVSSNYTGFALDNSFLFMADNNRRSLRKLDRETKTVEDFPMKVFTTPYAISRGPITYSPAVTTNPSEIASSTTDSRALLYSPNMTLIIAICSGVGGSVLLIVIIIVVVVRMSKRKKRHTSGASNDLQSLPTTDPNNYDIIVSGEDVVSLYDVIDDQVGTESGYEGLQPYEIVYDQHRSSENHAFNLPEIDLNNAEISGDVYQTNIPQHGIGEVNNTEVSGGVYLTNIPNHGIVNVGYTTKNPEKEQRSYEHIQDPYKQGYEHLQPRDGEASRYTNLQRAEPGEIGHEQLQGNSGTNPQTMNNVNPPYQALNTGREAGGI